MTEYEAGAWFYYKVQPESDELFRIYWSDGSSTEVTYTEMYRYGLYSIEFPNNIQLANHWTVGNTYSEVLSISGYSCIYRTKIISNPIKSVVIVGNTALEYAELTHGEWIEDNNDVDPFARNGNGVSSAKSDMPYLSDEFWFRYRIPADEYTYHVTLQDNTETDMTAAEIEKEYGITLRKEDSQSNSTPWEKENTYAEKICFGTARCTKQVAICESDYVSITALEPLTVCEYTYGWWTEDAQQNSYFEYFAFPSSDMKFQVALKNQTTVTKTFAELIDEVCVFAPYYGENPQPSSHWYKGNSYTLDLYFGSVACALTVTIVDFPIVSVEALDTVYLMEGRDGRWMSQDWDTLDHYESGAWFYYDEWFNNWESYNFEGTDAPRLKVTTIDGEDRTMTYAQFREEYGLSLTRWSADQYNHHWATGQSYSLKVTYEDLFEFYIPVETVSCSVSSISMSGGNVVTLTTNCHGEYRDRYGNTTITSADGAWYCYTDLEDEWLYTVKLTEGTVKQYMTADEIEEEFHIAPTVADNQKSSHWTAGSSNSVKIYVGRAYTTGWVFIENRAFAKAELVPDQTITVTEYMYSRGAYSSEWRDSTGNSLDTYQDGAWCEYQLRDDDCASLFVKLTMLDGTQKTVTYAQARGQYGLWASNYEIQSPQNPWTVGGENKALINVGNGFEAFSVELQEFPFTKVEALSSASIYENFFGCWINGEGSVLSDYESGAWFKYNGWGIDYCNLPFLVTMKNGTQKQMTVREIYQTYNIWPSYSYTKNQEAQMTSHWTTEQPGAVQLYFGKIPCTLSVTIKPFPITKIEATSPCSVTEYTYGSWRSEGGTWLDHYVPDAYYYYNCSNCLSSYLFDVTMRDGSTQKMTKQQICNMFDLNWSSSDTQNTTHWEAGNTYPVTMEFGERSCTVDVSITAYPFTKIESLTPCSVTEKMYGYWVDGESGSKLQEYQDGAWFCYYSPIPTRNSNYGSFRVTMRDGSIKQMTQQEIRSTYGIAPKLDGAQMIASQEAEHWTAGNTYSAVLYFGKLTCEVQTTVKEFPYVSMEPVSDITLAEWTYGNWVTANGNWVDEYQEGAWYYYQPFSWGYDAQFRMTKKDGTQVVVSHWELDDEMGTSLEMDTAQYESHWEAGNTYPVSVSIGPISCTLHVTIKPYPIKDIEFISGRVVTENTLGSWISADGNWLDEYQEGAWYYYSSGDLYWEMPCRVTLLNGSQVEMTLLELQERYGIYPREDDNQGDEHWEVGGTYPMTLTFGKLTRTVNVTIEEFPITDIRLTKSDVTIYQYAYGGWLNSDGTDWTTNKTSDAWYYYSENTPYLPLTCRVTLKNGTERNMTLRELCNEYKINLLRSDTQQQTHWSYGKTYEVTLSLGEFSFPVQVTVSQFPFRSVSLTGTTSFSLYEHDFGRWIDASWNSTNPDAPGAVFYYYPDDLARSITVKVTMNDWTRQTMTLAQLQEEYGIGTLYADWQGSYSTLQTWTAGNTYSANVEIGTHSLSVQVGIVPRVEGDINGDQIRDITDMACLYTYLSTLEYDGETYCRDTYLENMDANGDDAVNILDYQALYEMIKA